LWVYQSGYGASFLLHNKILPKKIILVKNLFYALVEKYFLPYCGNFFSSIKKVAQCALLYTQKKIPLVPKKVPIKM
jgi:hypothetical protein